MTLRFYLFSGKLFIYTSACVGAVTPDNVRNLMIHKTRTGLGWICNTDVLEAALQDIMAEQKVIDETSN